MARQYGTKHKRFPGKRNWLVHVALVFWNTFPTIQDGQISGMETTVPEHSDAGLAYNKSLFIHSPNVGDTGTFQF